MLPLGVDIILTTPNKDRTSFYKCASALALITIFYNLAEGMISVFFGFEDGTIALFGFGVDSFVEVISGMGIWHMVSRMRQSRNEPLDTFERTALRVTGGAFYLLALGLTFTALMNLYMGSRPETTLWGIIVSGISILTMWLLMHYKVKIGRRFNSEALLADAACTKTCIYLSIVLLISSMGYEVTGIGMLDSFGAAGIAFFAYKEGREAFGKAKGMSCGCLGKCST
ncbi:MAG TPA: cation transporter [Thermodesulfovibrionales bacterium]|nr:cation transporter [Thermodesulfovibrionales bacterium]